MSYTHLSLIKGFDCISHYTLMNGGIETTLKSFQALNTIENALVSTNNTYIRTTQLSTKFRHREPIPCTFQQRQSWMLHHWATPPHTLLHSVKTGFFQTTCTSISKDHTLLVVNKSFILINQVIKNYFPLPHIYKKYFSKICFYKQSQISMKLPYDQTH